MKSVTRMNNLEIIAELERNSGINRAALLAGILADVQRGDNEKRATIGEILEDRSVREISDRISEIGIPLTSRNYELVMGLRL